MGIEVLEIKIELDYKGVNILRRSYVDVNGTRAYFPQERMIFRTYKLNQNNEEIVNNDFYSEVDSFTGIDNFIQTKFNF